MATIAYTEPRLVGSGNLKEPKIFIGAAAPSAAWRRGSILANVTTGTITTPPASGTGSLANVAGPSASAVTITNAVTANAPARTYYISFTYTGSSAESLISQVFVQNCPAGYTPEVNIASAGAPSGATGYNFYVGLINGYIAQQGTAATALGTAQTLPATLTNSIGWNQASTNASSGIVGLAVAASNENFFDGSGGSFNVGPGSRTGANTGVPPLAPGEAQLYYAAGLGQGQLVEMNLSQAYAFYPSLIGTTAGLTLDASSGFFIADPSQTNKILTIVDQRPGVQIGPTASGTDGDLGVRVVVQFNSGLALS